MAECLVATCITESGDRTQRGTSHALSAASWVVLLSCLGGMRVESSVHQNAVEQTLPFLHGQGFKCQDTGTLSIDVSQPRDRERMAPSSPEESACWLNASERAL